MKVREIRKSSIDILFFITNLFLFYNYVTGSFNGFRLFALYGFFLAIYFSIGFNFLVSKNNLKLYFIWFLAIFIMALQFLIYGTLEHGGIVSFTVVVIIGVISFNNELNKNHQLIFMLIVYSYFARLFLVGVSPSEIMAGVSYNHISVVLLYSTILFYLSHNALEIKNKQYSILPAIICFVLCIFSVGRAGMISSAILLICLMLLKFKSLFLLGDVRKKIQVFLFLILSFIAVYYLILHFYNTGLFLKFEERGLESEGRFYVIRTFMNNLDGDTLLIGENKNFFKEETGLTAHISYLAWINSFGFSGILLIIYTLYTLFRYLKSNSYHFVLLFVLLIRSLTDNVLILGKPMFGVLLVIFMIGSECQMRPIKTSKKYLKDHSLY